MDSRLKFRRPIHSQSSECIATDGPISVLRRRPANRPQNSSSRIEVGARSGELRSLRLGENSVLRRQKFGLMDFVTCLPAFVPSCNAFRGAGAVLITSLRMVRTSIARLRSPCLRAVGSPRGADSQYSQSVVSPNWFRQDIGWVARVGDFSMRCRLWAVGGWKPPGGLKVRDITAWAGASVSERRPRSVSPIPQGLKGRNKTRASFQLDVPRFQRGEDFLCEP